MAQQSYHCIGEAIPPDHASLGVTVISHVGAEVPQQNNGVPGRGTIQHPRQGRQEGRVLHTTARPVGRNDTQRPVPNLKAQGCDGLIHWGKPQHETAELGASIIPSLNRHLNMVEGFECPILEAILSGA
ncbi:hypothetical protein CRENBAI_018435 [Crenichthys baileyi]|uniref:Uncharacterized protein n=1 Tax=Crenichthys baileyi TaxID=28760 RepID=A0AAV9SQI8_9TELE